MSGCQKFPTSTTAIYKWEAGFIGYSRKAAHNKDRLDGTSAVNDTSISARAASSAAVHSEDSTTTQVALEVEFGSKLQVHHGLLFM